MNHTPAQWRVDLAVECPNFRIVGPDGRGVAVAIQRDPHPTDGQGITAEEALANACLIAASPRLLELVRISIGNIRSLGSAGALGNVPYPYQEWLVQMEAAYAKATEAGA